jgi:hypothetical protein
LNTMIPGAVQDIQRNLLNSALDATQKHKYRIIGGNDSSDSIEHRISGITTIHNFSGGDVSFFKAESEKGAQGGFWKVFNGGQLIATEIGSKTASELRRAYSDTIVDWRKAIKSQRTEIAKTISSIFSDGVLDWKTEKNQLQKFLEHLNDELARAEWIQTEH